MTARHGCMEGRWPGSPTGFETASRELATSCNQLVGRILSLLEPRACPDLEPGTLAGAHTLWGEDGQCTLRYLHYPPMDVDTLSKLTGGSEAMHWRAGPHTDWDCITLLFQRLGQSGLECSANPRDTSKPQGWAAVPPTDGGIAINIGDMLSRWSDGRLHSNLHR
jgi:isopenicillin N synthase-like dioxygenase